MDKNKTSRFKQRRRLFLREWRKHRGLTLEELGEKIDMSAGNLSHLERGMVAYTQDTIEALVEALGTDVVSLFIGPPNEGEAIWAIWERATPSERQKIVEIAMIVVKKATD